MEKPWVFRYQTEWRLRCSCSDLTGAISAVVRYEKADGTTGNFVGTLEKLSPTGVVYFDTSLTADLSVAGEMKFWPEITFTGGYMAPGRSVRIEVLRPGE
jgi:hypothetical protein